MAGVNLEDLIVKDVGKDRPSIVEALLSTVDAIFTNNRMLQRSRLTSRHVRGVTRLVGTQSFIRTRLQKKYEPFIDADTGEFTTKAYDNRVLSAVADAVIAGRISLDGKSREEIIRIFQAVGGAETEVPKRTGLFGGVDY